MAWDGDLYKLVYTLTLDGNVDASVRSCIVGARENARRVREQISTEQWQRLNRMFHNVTMPRNPAERRRLHAGFHRFSA